VSEEAFSLTPCAWLTEIGVTRCNRANLQMKECGIPNMDRGKVSEKISKTP
jgi:hypothetical protein